MPVMARMLLTLVLSAPGTNHFYCQSILGPCPCGNKSFFQSSVFNLGRVCVWGVGETYINALFLTCLACFGWRSMNVWRTKVCGYSEAITVGLFLSKSYSGCLSGAPLFPRTTWRESSVSLCEGAACMLLYALMWWFPYGVWAGFSPYLGS